MKKEKWIGLLDCNNFFVSCERLFRPDLKNTPTVVLSSNDGCAVARSKEIKEMGIAMGVPYFKVKAELDKAEAAVFSSNFALYRDISSRVMTILQEEVSLVEQYSVDEAFFALDLPDNAVLKRLEEIKEVVETKVGVPVSVGAAKTKTIAKYASEVGKKGSGIALITGESWVQASKTLPVHEIWGIGRQTSQKMRDQGIVNVADLLAIDRSRMDKIFGVSGLRLLDELSEKSVHTLGAQHDVQKSIMSTRSFKNTTTNRTVVEDAIAYHVSHAAEELRQMNQKASWLSVMAHTSRHGDWLLRGGTKDALLTVPTNDTRELLKEALSLFDSIYESDVPYKKAGVVLGNFSDAFFEQMNLFADIKQTESSSKIMKTIDGLNRRFGRETVTIGRHFMGVKWQTSKEYVSPNYTTNWSEIPVVKA